jgi:membrane-bound ClpP family serine protease
VWEWLSQLIATATEKIVMSDRGTIGAATPMQMGQPVAQETTQAQKQYREFVEAGVASRVCQEVNRAR